VRELWKDVLAFYQKGQKMQSLPKMLHVQKKARMQRAPIRKNKKILIGRHGELVLRARREKNTTDWCEKILKWVGII
jgi:glutathione peroxidase-family protein